MDKVPVFVLRQPQHVFITAILEISLSAATVRGLLDSY